MNTGILEIRILENCLKIKVFLKSKNKKNGVLKIIWKFGVLKIKFKNLNFGN